MKFVDEYRREEDAQAFVRAIRAKVTRPWTLPERGVVEVLQEERLDEALREAAAAPVRHEDRLGAARRRNGARGRREGGAEVRGGRFRLGHHALA